MASSTRGPMGQKQRNLLKKMLEKSDEMGLNLRWNKDIEADARSLQCNRQNGGRYIDYLADAGVPLPWDKGEKPSEKQIAFACALLESIPDNAPYKSIWSEDYFKSLSKLQVSRCIDSLIRLRDNRGRQKTDFSDWETNDDADDDFN